MRPRWLLYALILPTSLLPVTENWVGGNSGNWNTAANWSPAAVPNATDTIVTLITGPTTAASISLDTNATIGTLQFDNSLGYTLSTPTGGGARTLTFSASTGSAQILITNTNGNGAHTIGGVDPSTPEIVFSSPLLITQGSSSTFTISGSLNESGTQTLTKTGSGALLLSSSGGNTYSGGTTISAGSVNVSSNTDNQLGSGTITLSNATLIYTNSAGLTSTKAFTLTGAAVIQNSSTGSVTLSGILSGSGSLQKTGTGTITLSGANTYSGGTNLQAGALAISSNGNLGASTSSVQISNASLLLTSAISTSRTITASGSSLIDTGSNANTFSGNFSGSGTLTVQGGGTLTLTGTGIYSGAVALTASGTTLVTNTAITPGNMSLGASTVLIFNQTTNGTSSGVITGSGALTKTGSAITTLSGNSASFSGATTISQGTLAVNGSLAASSVTVASGATLGGIGTVGTTTNNGTIAPGNSIGTLNINGALTLNASSILDIEIAPLNADLIAVNGAATLDGTLAVSVTPGFYGSSATYTILTSTGLTPAFATVTLDTAGFTPNVSYSGNNVLLGITVLEPFAAFPFSNENTEAVGNNLNTLYTAGELTAGLTAIMNSFVGESSSTINDALDQMHPAPYSALTELQVEVDAQILSLFHRMPDLSCNAFQPCRFWIEPFGNFLTVKSHGDQVGFQGNSGGVAFGLDGKINNVVLGFGGAWNQNHLSWHRDLGKAKSNGFYGGLYMDYISPKQFYFGWSVLGGLDFYDTSRHIDFPGINEHAKANFNALDIMAQVSFAQLFGSPLAYFYPYANIDFLYFDTRQINEDGASALDLTVKHRFSETIRSELGLAIQVKDTNVDETLCLSPKFAIGWVNMTPLRRTGFKATFEGVEIPFTTYGWDQTWNLLALDFGLKFSGRTFALGFDYNLEMSPDSHTLYFNQHGIVQFSWGW